MTLTLPEPSKAARVTTRRWMPLPFAVAMLASAGLVFGADPASAHDSMTGSSPAVGSTITESISEVTLTFSAQPSPDFLESQAIHVTDPNGERIDEGTVRVDAQSLITRVTPTVNGPHHVAWQAISTDGHTISGEYDFEYAGIVATAAPTGSPLETATASPSPVATPQPDASDAGDDLAPVAIIVGVGIGVVAIAAAVILVIFGRRRRSL